MAYGTLKYLKKDLPNGFVKVDKKTIQKRLTPLLRDLMEVAKKENIKIYLVFGSLLGYERHNKSFIPWDDDIDVAVSYWDRDRLAIAIEKWFKIKENHFKRIGSREWPGLEFSTKEYGVITSSYFENKNINYYSVDIFEFANFRKANDYKKIKNILNLLFIKRSTGKGLQRVARILIKPIPKNFLTKVLHRREEKYIQKDGEYEWIIIDDLNKSWKSTFNNSNKKGNFEGVEVNLPVDSNVFLSANYGDWRKKPDEKSINWNTHFFGERKNSKSYLKENNYCCSACYK